MTYRRKETVEGESTVGGDNEKATDFITCGFAYIEGR